MLLFFGSLLLLWFVHNNDRLCRFAILYVFIYLFSFDSVIALPWYSVIVTMLMNLTDVYFYLFSSWSIRPFLSLFRLYCKSTFFLKLRNWYLQFASASSPNYGRRVIDNTILIKRRKELECLHAITQKQDEAALSCLVSPFKNVYIRLYNSIK